MKTRVVPLWACLDSNVYISAIAFGGTPLKVLERGLSKDFNLVTSIFILKEVRKNLVRKLGLKSSKVDRILQDILDVSSAFVPTGNHKYIEHDADNLVIETALMGGSDVLVTGDRKHLLPLGSVMGLVIEPPSRFLLRLG